MKFEFGMQLKKKVIKIDRDLREIYKLEGACLGYLKDYSFVPVSGNRIGEKIDLFDDSNNESSVFIPDLQQCIDAKDDIIKIIEAHSNADMDIYYFYNNYGLKAIKDPLIIAEADKVFGGGRKSKEFNEDSMDTKSDISIMYKDIKKTILSQDEQIMKILTSLFKNQRVVDSTLGADIAAKLKENILIAGPTGTGKTEILTRISKRCQVPIVIEDSTSLAETGYVGRKVEDLLRDLYLAADKDQEKAEKGILVIDEFDKLAEKGSQEMVSRSGVQRALLKLLDGGTLYFDGMTFDTSKLTIVGLGAFSDITDKENYDHITTDDLVKYGMMQELIGRFSKVIKMNSLSKEDLKKILKESNLSPLNTYKGLFEELKVDFSYDDGFVNFVATKAESLNTGARSLKTIFDDQISGALFNIFAGEYKAIHLVDPITNEGQSYKLYKEEEKSKEKKKWFQKN